MKRPLLILWVCCFIFSLTNAQSHKYPNAISIGGQAIDYISPYTKTGINPQDFHYGMQIAYHRNLLGNLLNVEIPLRMGNAIVASRNIAVQEFTLEQSLFSTGALFQLQYFKPDNFLVPYISAGGNVTYVGQGGGHFEVPVGVGLDMKVRAPP